MNSGWRSAHVDRSADRIPSVYVRGRVDPGPALVKIVF
jgi:hypothetical protein